MRDVGGSESLAAWTLKLEATRMRDLLAQARESHLPVKDLRRGFRLAGQLTEEARFAEALARLREVKVELLALLFLHERQLAVRMPEVQNPPTLDSLLESIEEAVVEGSPSEFSGLEGRWLVR